MRGSQPDEVGLCFTCRNARRIETRNRVYWLCRLAARDARFEKYPRLPVLACDGYRRLEEGGGAAGATGPGAPPGER